jgi:hypothetical protein
VPAKKIVHGDDLLYRFFQDGLRDEPELFAVVPQMLITTMGIWLPLDVYAQWPVMLPWVVRDASCRGSKRLNIPDEWSAPHLDTGYLRDDNSLIKALPRSFTVKGPPGSHIHGARMGSEFVASHVWRVVEHADLASRIPLLNSFVPNLIWLPGQVAKLTDVEGDVVQQTLQAMSYSIYRDAPVARHLEDIRDEAWAMIPAPQVAIRPFAIEDLNWFQATPAFFRTRTRRLVSVIAALDAIEHGQPVAERVVSRRYAQGLPRVDPVGRGKLGAYLREFLEEEHEK